MSELMETALAEDVLHRFVLERAGVRGALVRLGASWQKVAAQAEYPPVLRNLLGESLAASALLTAHIKLEGALSLELKSADALRLLFAECSDQGRLRGLARWQGSLPTPLALSALSEASMAITIGRAERGQRYQGLVALEQPQLAGILQDYFACSEQIPTRLVLAADASQAVGLIVQRLPDEGGHAMSGADAADDVWAELADGWARVGHFTDTLGAAEALALPPEQLLHRLYHQEQLRLFEPRSLRFGCSCSRERVAAMLRALGREEVEAALEERHGEIEVMCEFCAEPYLFDRIDAEHLLRTRS